MILEIVVFMRILRASLPLVNPADRSRAQISSETDLARGRTTDRRKKRDRCVGSGNGWFVVSSEQGGRRMASKEKGKIFPHFWYAKDAEEAAKFYAATFPNSRVDNVTSLM